MIDRLDRVLPDLHFPGHQRTEVAGHRTHVAVGQLEPGTGERVGERLRVLHEAARDFLVGRIHAQGHIGGGHHRRMTPGRVMRVRNRARAGVALRLPLLRAGRASGQLPFVAEQSLEVAIVPGGRVGLPGTFQAAGDGVRASAAGETVDPAEALFFNPGPLGFATHMAGGAGPVRLAEGVPTGHQRNGLFVVHGHAGKGFADVACRAHRVRLAVRAFGIHVNQAHLHCGQRIVQLAVAAIALIAQPLAFRAPVDVLFRFPDVGAPAGETEGLETHRLQRHVAGKDQQVGPGDIAAVFLLDRPQKAARLVEVAVVGPAVERCETLRAGADAAATIGDTVGARSMPGHADEKGSVVAVVCGPPVLRIGHQGMQVLDYGVQIKALERRGIVE